ncbi:MAG TPA: NAD(P)-dependent oxidoreductase, partial [Candidatus Krumholzibacteria bacterium]|nr:NAD(P)-dependent oxidoreductase [Candidatus Krumholzibacteria bacterium]
MSQAPTSRRRFDLEDGDLSLLKGKRIAVLGYGNQGHAHALNLRDSGMEVVVGLRKESAHARAAREAGFEVEDFASAARGAFLVMMLLPDELHAEIYDKHLRKVMDSAAYLAFSHGFAVAFDLLELEKSRRVLLVAPKGQGHALRASFVNGG